MRTNWFRRWWQSRRPVRKARTRPRGFGLEWLEDRVVPTGQPANVFALFSGTLAPGGGQDSVRIRLLPENFTIPSPHVTLGFVPSAAPGSQLAPNPVAVDPVG